jgi:hypothetical protein
MMQAGHDIQEVLVIFAQRSVVVMVLDLLEHSVVVVADALDLGESHGSWVDLFLFEVKRDCRVLPVVVVGCVG